MFIIPVIPYRFMRLIPALFIIPFCLLIHGSPADAAVIARDVRVDPAVDALVEGDAVTLAVSADIIPAGATTFSPTHALSLRTDLLDPRWDVVVIVDGKRAAVIPKTGARVCINGYLLSYPTTRDVGLAIGLGGQVPSGIPESGGVLVAWSEIDGQGRTVPGSGFGVALPGDRPFLGETSPPPEPAPASPSRSTGTKAPLAVIGTIFGLCIVFCRAARGNR